MRCLPVNSTPRHAPKRLGEPIRVLALSLVESESLLVQVSEKVVRLDRHIRSVYPALQEAPKVLQTVRVDVASNVCFSVVYYVVDVLGIQTLVTLECISVNF